MMMIIILIVMIILSDTDATWLSTMKICSSMDFLPTLSREKNLWPWSFHMSKIIQDWVLRVTKRFQRKMSSIRCFQYLLYCSWLRSLPLYSQSLELWNSQAYEKCCSRERNTRKFARLSGFLNHPSLAGLSRGVWVEFSKQQSCAIIRTQHTLWLDRTKVFFLFQFLFVVEVAVVYLCAFYHLEMRSWKFVDLDDVFTLPRWPTKNW